MNSKVQLYTRLIEDRKQGVSLLDLSKKYDLSKSTVSLWCRDVILSAVIKNTVRQRWLKNNARARAKGVLTNKKKRTDSIESEYAKAKEIMGNTNDRDLLVMGVGLYWAEGSKKERGSGFSFINSDHLMIKLMHEWLIKVVHITPDQLFINLVINSSHRKRESEILKFWSNLLDLPVSGFGSTTFIDVPHRRIYQNHSQYFGMLRIRVRSSAWLRRRILGMIRVFVEKMPA